MTGGWQSSTESKTLRPNLTPGQYPALRALCNDNNIVILPAYKGRATVVLNKEEYTSKMKQIVEDRSNYRPISRDPIVRVENRIATALKKLCKQGHIEEKLCDYLVPHYSSPPQLYGLPKVHKDGVPMRPIVSEVGSPCYKLVRELARILTPLAGLNGYTVKNSISFVEAVKELQISPQDHLVSFDVTNLFTQVLITEALRVIEERLAGDQSLESRTNIPVFHLWNLWSSAYDHLTSNFKTPFMSRLMVQPWAALSRPSLRTCIWNI